MRGSLPRLVQVEVGQLRGLTSSTFPAEEYTPRMFLAFRLSHGAGVPGALSPVQGGSV